jgi:hypothetical protein
MLLAERSFDDDTGKAFSFGGVGGRTAGVDIVGVGVGVGVIGLVMQGGGWVQCRWVSSV